ncbi:hypothetical protein [uncultured Jatrophihabitans sp.]|uniref:hypothetical protein n=1 Tax=uncultured Jatrophihabitans sp. TaxID=1610747 RepID=UPI0035CBD601
MTQAPATPADAQLRPLGTAEILDGAVRLVRGNFRAVLSVSVPVAVVTTALRALLLLAQAESPGATIGSVGGGVFLNAWAGVLLGGLLAPLFAASLLGHRRSVRATLPRLARTVGILALLGLLVAVAETAGLFAFAVGGVWLWGVWAVAAPACSTEQLRVFAALRRSTQLVRNTFWRTWGIRALGWLLTSVLGMFVTLPAQLLADLVTGTGTLDSTGVAEPTLFVAIVAVGTLLAAAVVAPVAAAIDVLLYTDLRMRKEGLDLVLALPPAAEPDVPAPAPVTAW